MNASIFRVRSASASPAAALLAGVLMLAAPGAHAEITWSGGYPHRHAGDRGWQYGYDPYRGGADHGLVTGSRRHGLRGHDGRRDNRSGAAIPAQPFSRHRVPPGSHDAYREPARGYGYDNRYDRGRGSRYGYGTPRYRPETQPGFVPDAGRGSRGTERAYRDGYRDGYTDRRAPYRPRYSNPPRYRDARPRYAPGYVPGRD